MSEDQIHGLSGRYTWLRRRVWLWERRGYINAGWSESERERGLLRTVMVQRVDVQQAQSDYNRLRREWLDAQLSWDDR